MQVRDPGRSVSRARRKDLARFADWFQQESTLNRANWKYIFKKVSIKSSSTNFWDFEVLTQNRAKQLDSAWRKWCLWRFHHNETAKWYPPKYSKLIAKTQTETKSWKKWANFFFLPSNSEESKRAKESKRASLLTTRWFRFSLMDFFRTTLTPTLDLIGWSIWEP